MGTRRSLEALLSRNPQDRPTSVRMGDVFVTNLDLGIYGEPALHTDADGSLSVMAGEPLLDAGGGTGRSRSEDLMELHQSWSRGDWSRGVSARGVYCAAHYTPAHATLSLITDRLGIRCLYYWESPEYVVFATALRILEGCAFVPKQLDLRGVTEITCFGYPLADRTPYAGIRMLQSGEVVQFDATTSRRHHYWRWERVRSMARRSRRRESESGASAAGLGG
jgi:asparagine synthase (glutamine-hydrolysing)